MSAIVVITAILAIMAGTTFVATGDTSFTAKNSYICPGTTERPSVASDYHSFILIRNV